MNYWLIFLHKLNKLKAAKSASELSEAISFHNVANFEPAPPLSSIQRSNIPKMIYVEPSPLMSSHQLRTYYSTCQYSSHQLRRWLRAVNFKVHCEPSHARNRLIKSDKTFNELMDELKK